MPSEERQNYVPEPGCLLLLYSYLLSILVGISARPKQMGTGAHSPALVGLLQELGGCQRTLSPQRLMVLLAEALHPLKRPNYQGDCSQLCFRITDFIFIQREGLVKGEHKTLNNHFRTHQKKNNRSHLLRDMAVKCPLLCFLKASGRKHHLSLRAKNQVKSTEWK